MNARARRADKHGAFSGNRVDRAIIDVGSNTVRLVLYGGSPRAPVTLFNEKVAARLGREISQTGRLADAAIALAMRGLRRYALLLRDLKIERIDVVATAAPREASNGPAFLDEVRELGFKPRLLSGEEEARISAMGVLGAFPGARGTVADLGGGSLELVHVAGGNTDHGISLPLGTLRLGDHRGDTAADTRRNLVTVLDRCDRIGPVDGTLYLVGGTWRSMAVLAMEDRDYPLTDPHAFSLRIDEARALADRVAQADSGELAAHPRISSMRAGSLPDAGVLLGALLERLQPDRIVFSSWGVREGLLFDELADFAKSQDPLLAGVGEFAQSRGTPAVLAARIAGWTVGAVPSRSSGSERVRLAATMLALASMQVEPNLRVDIATDWALHKRWLALDPAGRAMIAATAYGNGNRYDLPPQLSQLASEHQLQDALSWGLAIRLCRRLGGRSSKLFRVSHLQVEGDTLLLSIENNHAALFGIPNEKDLALLASRLGLKPVMQTVSETGMARIETSKPM